MALWQKGIIGLGALLLAYAEFDGTREYGIVWQAVSAVAGGITGAIGGFLLIVYLADSHTAGE
jgi:hypothetical protein